MFCQQFTRCSRVGSFHGLTATLAQAITPRFFSTTRNAALKWPWRWALQEDTIPEPTPEDIEYIGQGMSQADRLTGATQRVQSYANRRALIVAPRYEDHARTRTPTFQRMPYTVQDARLMHETLVRRGYKPGDIRILADGYPQFNGLTDPTRQNVLDSLKWLVDGAQKEDYRFFYFSGHGERLPSRQGQGKQARRVNENSKPDSNDTERLVGRNEPSKWSPTEWPLKQVIPEKHIVYYNEAIITTLSTNSNYDGTSGINFRIEDRELNALFALLPEGSNLTVSIKAGASFLDNCVKVAGAGFRGATTEKLKDKLRAVPKKTRKWLDTIKRWFDFTKVEKEEKILPDKRALNNIKANALTWASCHQRQDSFPHNDKRSGRFTRIWTETVNEDESKSISVGDLYDIVSSRTMDMAMEQEPQQWQYVQLWTSTGYDDEEIKKKIMDRPFDI